MMRASIRTLGTLVGTLCATTAMAAIVPAYPAPGGSNLSQSGTGSGSAGGRTNSYSAFDAGTLSSGLYWGKDSTTTVQLSLDGPTFTGAETMTFAGAAGNVAQWTGSSTIYISNGASYVANTVNTRFTVTTTKADNSALNFVTPVSVDAAFPAAADAVVPVTGNFNANLLFEFQYGGTWYPAVDKYNTLSTDPSITSPVTRNFSGAFYAVPEPAGLAILALSAATGLGRRRRV